MRFVFEIFGVTLRLHSSFYTLPVQLLWAELLFLYSYNRRSRFALRLTLGTLAYMVIATVLFNIFPVRTLPAHIDATRALLQGLQDFARVISLIVFSVVLFFFCYKEKIGTILSACMAGYVVQHFTFKLGVILEELLPIRSVLDTALSYQVGTMFLYYLPVYTLAFLIFAKPAVKNDYKNHGSKYLNLLSLVIIFSLIVINRFLAFAHIDNPIQKIADALYAMLCCVLALVIQFVLYRYLRLETEYETTRALFHQGSQSYLQWKDSLDEIHVRYHDLRHKLDFLAETGVDTNSPAYREIQSTLDTYSTMIRSGNEAIDVLIAGKKSICRQAGIEFSCMIDGKVLQHFDGMQLYNLFNNALDNAINYLKTLDCVDNRVMYLSIKPLGDAAFITIENYFEGTVKLENGLPVSEQADSGHGYGFKSMKRIVDFYSGTMTIATENHMFSVGILLPYPKADK